MVCFWDTDDGSSENKDYLDVFVLSKCALNFQCASLMFQWIHISTLLIIACVNKLSSCFFAFIGDLVLQYFTFHIYSWREHSFPFFVIIQQSLGKTEPDNRASTVVIILSFDVCPEVTGRTVTFGIRGKIKKKKSLSEWCTFTAV